VVPYQLVVIEEHLLSTATHLASFQLYEILLTMSVEIDLVWKRKWGLGNAIFLLGRYTALLDCAGLLMMRKFKMVLSLCAINVATEEFRTLPSDRSCRILYQIVGCK
jgi:hypothetical protein